MKVVVTVGLLVAAVVGIYALRSATMSRDTPPGVGSSLAVVLRAYTVREPESATEQYARTLVRTCRLQVDSTLVEEGFLDVGSDVFRFVLRPALHPSDRRELHGCLEDARIEHLQADVLSIQEYDPDAPVDGTG